jgi:hypothetical protein
VAVREGCWRLCADAKRLLLRGGAFISNDIDRTPRRKVCALLGAACGGLPYTPCLSCHLGAAAAVRDERLDAIDCRSKLAL